MMQKSLALAFLFSALMPTSAWSGQGLTARIYQFTTVGPDIFNIPKLKRVDPAIDFDFKQGGPGVGLPTNNFAIRWTGYVTPQYTGTYVFATCTDDGVQLYIDGKLVVDKFNTMNATLYTTPEMQLVAGKKYKIRMDYFDSNDVARAHLLWMTTGGPITSFPAKDGASCSNFDRTLYNKFIVPQAVLDPEGNELDEAVADCNVQPTFLSPSQAPDPTSPNTQRAIRLFARLSGTEISLFDSRLKEMKDKLDQGKPKDAARIATADPHFYDITVRQLASKMATRDQVPDAADLNDFIATYVGVTRDLLDARKLLTGTFLYRAKPVFFWADNTVFDASSTLKSNRHYDLLDATGVPLKCALDEIWDLDEIPITFKQQVVKGDGTTTDNPEPAGLLTSRAFAEAHYVAGTNRRPVEKAFEHFLCSPIQLWRDAESADNRVGRDVTRFPAGTNNQQYLTECKSCHAGMDALRGAFAFWNFSNNIAKYSPFFSATNNMNEAENNIRKTASNNVVTKMNHNNVFDGGYVTTDNSFVNLSNERVNQSRFGWSGPLSGRGVGEFGRMLASSAAFPRCQARKVYEEVCKRSPSVALETWLNDVAQKFADGGYKLKDLFETIATNCLDD